MIQQIVLAIEDAVVRAAVRAALASADGVVEEVSEPRQLFRTIEKLPYDVLILSRSLLSEHRLKKIRPVAARWKGAIWVVLADSADSQDKLRLMGYGCEAVLDVSGDTAGLAPALQTLLEKQRHLALSMLTDRRDPDQASLKDFVSRSAAMQQFHKLARRVAGTDSTVLILGETGVGKERLAEALHAEGSRASRPFIAINCGAIAETLLESELFGHEAGAFTGATGPRKGCFELAHTGTLFLDEIGEMPTHLQIKLLRALDKRQIQRVGSEKTIPVDVRVMAATNRDLEQEIRDNRFRRDLFHRLNTVTLIIPPLRQRREDIPELIESYVEYLGPRVNRVVTGVSADAVTAMSRYDWPGNVRELINVLERALLLCEGDTITCSDLPATVTGYLPIPAQPDASVGSDWVARLPSEWLELPLKDAARTLQEHFEMNYLRHLLQETGGRVGRTAERAGIDSRTLFEKMKAYQLRKEDFKPV